MAQSWVSVPAEVASVVASLTPSSAISSRLRPATRSPGSLHWQWAVVPVESLHGWLGFAPPRLASLRGEQVQECFAVAGRDGVPWHDLEEHSDDSDDPQGLLLAVFYLPAGLSWPDAHRFSVVRDGLTWLRVGAAQDVPWPARPSSRVLPRGRDFAVVDLAGVAVGVQLDTSGVVQLSWALQRRSHSRDVALHASLLIKTDPVDALALLLTDGVLT